MARALSRKLAAGDRLTLFSSSWKDRMPRDPVPGAVVVDARVPVSALNFAWHRLNWPPVERLTGAADVVHAFHPLLIPASRAAQVVTIHDLYFLDRPEDTRAEIRRDYPVLAGSHARRADAVIVNSEYTADLVRSRLNVLPERVTVCPPGAPEWEPGPGSRKGGPLLFVGTIEPRKNVGALLKAYERLLARMPDAPNLILAGGVSESCKAIVDQLGRAPLAGRARHMGYVTDAERQRLVREASVLVIPSLDEGFGLPALEAMTVGTPVVAANRGALPEVLGSAGLLVDPEDDAALAVAIERMLTDSALASHASARGMVRSRQFSWDASASRLVDAYRSAIERRLARQ
jgi:glycosyltransferase involved in cell wall biosynthesis